MKTLNEVQNDMADLYESVKIGKTEQKTADTLANIAGKWLKAEDLKFAMRVFEARRNKPALPHTSESTPSAPTPAQITEGTTAKAS